MKPLSCDKCNALLPDSPMIAAMEMGIGIWVRCPCGETVVIPWGRCGIDLIIRGREETAKK